MKKAGSDRVYSICIIVLDEKKMLVEHTDDMNDYRLPMVYQGKLKDLTDTILLSESAKKGMTIKDYFFVSAYLDDSYNRRIFYFAVTEYSGGLKKKKRSIMSWINPHNLDLFTKSQDKKALRELTRIKQTIRP